MEILKRADVPQEFTWDLTPVFANDDAWFAEYEALKALPERIAEYDKLLIRRSVWIFNGNQ